MYTPTAADLVDITRSRGLTYVPGEIAGDHPRYVMVGEAPGKEEEKRRQPFIGPSGRVLWQFALRSLGATRSNTYVTNLIKHRLPETWEKTGIPARELEMWGAGLEEELEEVFETPGLPKVVIALGRYAAQYLAEGFVSMEAGNGKPYRAKNPRLGYVIPVYHPAAGLHQTDLLTFTSVGLRAARDFYESGCLYQSSFTEKPQYRRVREAGEFQKLKLGPGVKVAIDTEWGKTGPWCLSYSTAPGRGGVIYATDTVLLQRFGVWLRKIKAHILFHSALADLRVLREMGIDIIGWGLTFGDTMVLSYLTQMYPRGLKPLAHRLSDMEMTDYHDVVQPYDDAISTEYLEDVVFGGHKFPAGIGRKKSIEARAKSILYPRKQKEDAKSAPASPRKKWSDLPRLLRKPVEKKLGPMPVLQVTDVPEKELVPYAARDADATISIEKPLMKEIERFGLQEVYALDVAVTPMVDAMQEHGLPLDMSALREFREELDESMGQIRAFIADVTGVPKFNPASSDQCATFLFEVLGLPISKFTKVSKKPSTDDKVLQALQHKHPVIPWIADYREDLKLRGILDGIAKRAKLESRSPTDIGFWLHPNLRTTTVVSGRLSANDPNVLALPTKTEKGRRVRKCFVAPEGYSFLSVDLSQIELREMAHESGDENMIAAFVSGEDLHWRTAKLMFKLHAGLKYDEGKHDHFTKRYAAKTLNFAILYGISADGLQKQFALAGIYMTVEDCAAMIEAWLSAYPRVREYMEAAVGEALRYGFVREPGGRIRHLPAVSLEGEYWPFNFLRGEAERQATNHKIQGGAQTILKRAMRLIWRETMPRLRREHVELFPMLQIHDELLFLANTGHCEYIGKLLVAAMTSREAAGGDFRVPLVAKAVWGPSWGDLGK